jgi:hypothetical protein
MKRSAAINMVIGALCTFIFSVNCYAQGDNNPDPLLNLALVNDYKKPGTYSLIWDAREVASGIYMCRLASKDYNATMKLILLK